MCQGDVVGTVSTALGVAAVFYFFGFTLGQLARHLIEENVRFQFELQNQQFAEAGPTAAAE